ncbi:MAG: TIR domain-containing protein [Acidimicrobiales bacterium]
MLPIKTTLDDVTQIVEYLRNKPAGATLKEAKAVLSAKPLDARKVRAYIAWDLVKEDGDKLRLDELGWRLARKPEESQQVYRAIIDGIRPYRAAIEWAYHQKMAEVTVNDVAAHWIEHYAKELGSKNEGSAKAAVTCFFNVADGAGLGRYVLGRGTNPTRLVLNAEVTQVFVESGPSVPPWEEDDDLLEQEVDGVDMGVDEESLEPDGESEQPASDVTPAEPQPPDAQQPLRVFIAHGKNMDIVEQVETVLGMVDIESEYAEAEESPAIPVPEKVMGAMRRCSAGIICVSVDEGHTDANGDYKINENVLIEIGAAFVLYDQRVVLLWDRRLKVPSNLQGLYRCEYEGNELGWGAGMKLMKAIKSFKK